MDIDVPQYVDARLRHVAPDNAFVVAGSTPVISFGDFTAATIATLGLNPSRNEFLAGDATELDGELRRLETTASLGVDSLATAPDELVARAWFGCQQYFKRRPYEWFNPLEQILKGIGASYYDG